jgi:hypothetical protein
LEGRGRRYGLNAIQLFLQCVLQVATSLRGASATMELFREFVPGLPRAPVANTGQMWLLQVGLYEVQRPKELAHDWVWLVDHAVQIGTVRCLVIVGCRAEEQYSNDRPLAHQDLSVFALEPVEKSDGATVARQLEELTSRTGIVPRAILSDHYWRVSHEYLLLGVRGNLPFRDRTCRSWISARRTIHSRKPFAFRELIERVSPGPYLELYGREEHPGTQWTVYGNQVERRLF